MEHAMNINSEEELLGLKNEGKISESEYAELLSAMRKPSPPPEPSESDDEYASKQKFGKTAFYLLLAGIVVPTIVFFISFAATGGGESGSCRWRCP